MKLNNKAWYMAIGGLLALVIVFGAVATFAQPGAAEPDTPAEESGDETTQTPLWQHPGGTPFGRGQRIGIGDKEALAEALGISVEDLEAAYAEAREAAIEQAVVDGLITQAQADQLLSGNRGLHAHRWPRLASALRGESFLADALGITVEELQAAFADVRAARLAEMVESGALTQEQADLMIARQAVNSYVDREALIEMMQSAYETAVEEALAEGAVTQAQADLLLENPPAFGQNGRLPGFGGRGGHGSGGFHGRPGGRMFGGTSLNQTPGTAAPTSTTAGSNA